VTRRRFAASSIAVLAALALAGCDALAGGTPGERIWKRRCAGCHGVDAAGNTPRYLGNSWADLTDDRWRGHGGDRAGLESSIRQGVGEMPGFPELTAEEMRALLDHLSMLRGETP
jgi:mono/diheme cytochrome c family protein